MDEKKLIRVGRRLKNSTTLDVYQRHSIVLLADCHFTRLLIKFEHDRYMYGGHGGSQATLCSVCLKYWLLNYQNIVRSIKYKCIAYFCYKTVSIQSIMGNLPTDQVEPTRAFLKYGIDFANHLMIKTSIHHNALLVKGYAFLFAFRLEYRSIHQF